MIQPSSPRSPAIAPFPARHAHRVDFTQFFRRLATVGLESDDLRNNPEQSPAAPGVVAAGRAAASGSSCRDLFLEREAFDASTLRWRERLRAEGSDDQDRALQTNRVNPKYILRKHLAELAIRQAREGDHERVRRLLHALERPYDEQPEHEDLAALPPDWAAGLEVSCSS